MVRPEELGGGSSNYSSINFAGMTSLVSQVRTAGTTLQETTKAFQDRATSCGVSSTAFSQIIEIGAWAEDEVKGLERRLTLAQVAQNPTGPQLTGWTISEPVELTATEAADKGEELAQKILNENTSGQDFIDVTDEALDELMNKYSDDPDVLSAFFAELGPHAQLLPSFLEGSGANDTTQVEKLSNALALAMKDPSPPTEFTELLDAMKSTPEHTADPISWDRLVLLQWGDFPADFVADVVKANGLQQLNDSDENIDWRARMGGGLGLDGDVRTLIFGALQDNPEATRKAFEGLDMEDIVTKIYDEGTFNFELQENFIEAMKAGTGTNDESAGSHSDEAARFALAFIKASASVEDVPDLHITKQGLAAIAASYAPEFVAGSSTMDALDRESGMDRPDNFDVPVGLDPAFFLSPEDVYKYLHGFGDLDERFDPPTDYSAPFDEAVGELYNQALLDAAEEVKRSGDPEAWKDTLAIFGNLGGLHLQAQLDVRSEEDEDDQATKDLMAGLLLKGVGFVPTPQGFVLKGGVMIAKYGANKAIKSWRETDPETTRAALLEDAAVQASFLTDYQLMNVLNESGFPGTENIPPALLEDGHLVSPDKLAEDPDLFKTYRDWVDSTDVGGSTDLDSMTEIGALGFEGGLGKGKNYGTTYGWD